MDAERIDEIRRQIEAGTYESSGRLAGTAAVLRLKVFFTPDGVCIVPGCDRPEIRGADDHFCASCLREFEDDQRGMCEEVADDA